MNSFLIFGVMFIPLYITYNWICFNKKSVSIWIGSEKVKVLDDTYFKLIFKILKFKYKLNVFFIYII